MASLLVARRLAKHLTQLPPGLTARCALPTAAPAGHRALSTATAKIFEATAQNFSAEVLQAPTPVVLDCHADWCQPCKTLGPLLRAAVESKGGAVALAMLDVDKEQQLSAQLQIQSLPTVFGVWQGKVTESFVGAKDATEIAQFVDKLAALSPVGAAPAAEPGPNARAEGFRLLTEMGDVAAAAQTFKAEYERLRTEHAAREAQAEVDASDPTKPRRKGLRKPEEFDDESPDAAEMAWCLYGLARCAMENAPPEPDAAAQLLGALRDERRRVVLDKNLDLKAAVAQLALALDPGAADDTPLAEARRVFASGDAAGAVDLALNHLRAVRRSEGPEKDEAKDLILSFIDAMGPGKESLRARQRLANFVL